MHFRSTISNIHSGPWPWFSSPHLHARITNQTDSELIYKHFLLIESFYAQKSQRVPSLHLNPLTRQDVKVIDLMCFSCTLTSWFTHIFGLCREILCKAASFFFFFFLIEANVHLLCPQGHLRELSIFVSCNFFSYFLYYIVLCTQNDLEYLNSLSDINIFIIILLFPCLYHTIPCPAWPKTWKHNSHNLNDWYWKWQEHSETIII